MPNETRRTIEARDTLKFVADQLQQARTILADAERRVLYLSAMFNSDTLRQVRDENIRRTNKVPK